MPDTLDSLRSALQGTYRVVRELGQGGMATVYLGHDERLDRPVAIKVLRPEVCHWLGPERFLREIRIAAKLSHPHVVQLYDSGEADGLLYYVMPYVQGETLRDRLKRTGPLPLDEALRIAGDITAALEYAHAQGFVHRDIKPSNVLLGPEYAIVADFGLARAVSTAALAGERSLSSSGQVVGTPCYMSPEQATRSEVDARSDIYAVGCVLYEMLVGEPPFTGPTPSAVLARHAVQPAPRVRVVRRGVPEWVDMVILRMLEKSPADRFQSAAELARALTGPVPVPFLRRLGARHLAGAAAVILALASGILIRRGTGIGGSRARPDTTLYAVMPFYYSDTERGALEVLVHDALARWTGIGVIERSRVVRALERTGGLPPTPTQAHDAARELGVGRYVRGEVLRVGDSLNLRATLYDTEGSTTLAQERTPLSAQLSGADAAMVRLAEALLSRGRLPTGPHEGPLGTDHVPALQAYVRGREALTDWDLRAADSAFARALQEDRGFARAALWLAQLRAWQGSPSRTWRLQAEQALTERHRLSPRDSALAGALSALSQRDFVTACSEWRAMTHFWPREFVAWYGLAICLAQDDAVLRDSRSPSGWRFRSSYHQAQLAWRRAFELLPAMYRSFQRNRGGAAATEWLLWTETNKLRTGSAVSPDTGDFGSFPTWAGDTLAFVPYPVRTFHGGRSFAGTGTTLEAIGRNRRMFYELATEWRSTSPPSIDAREALASALWLLGNPTAADSIRAARAVATKADDQVRLGVVEVLMLVLRAAPDARDLVLAKRLSDSLLTTSASTSGADPWDLATVAALTGRASQAAALARLPSRHTVWQLRPGLASEAFALLVFATLGGPPESLAVLEKDVVQGIQSGVEPRDRANAQMEWLVRPAALSLPELPFASLGELQQLGDYLLDAIAAYQSGDTARVRDRLAEAAEGRAWMRPSDVMLETLDPEARLLAGVGDIRAAIRRLDPTLSALQSVPLRVVRHPVGAGILVRAMALRAQLATQAGDPAAAALWGRAVAILWEDADLFLQPVVQRMRALARAERA